MVGGRVLKYADFHSIYYQARQIFGERLYDFTCDTSAPLILDCGAHVGLASLAFKDRYPAARIEAFEADAAIAAMCADNLADFGFTDVTVTTAAVWTHNNGVTFSASADDAGHVAGTGVAVPSVCLRDRLGGEPVHLLKLDIEGAEFAVLADCGEALRNVQRLIVEVHAFGGTRVGEMLALLENQGFNFTLGDLHAAPWMETTTRPPFAACPTDKYYFTAFAWR
jgi:FkbM family methyltransferase